MGEIEKIFDRIVTSGVDAVAAAKKNEAGLARRLLQSRMAYNDESAKLLQAVKTDARLRNNPEIAAQLNAKISQMRVLMGRMQAKWRMQEVEADLASYLADVAEVNRHNAALRDWVRATLGPLR